MKREAEKAIAELEEEVKGNEQSKQVYTITN